MQDANGGGDSGGVRVFSGGAKDREGGASHPLHDSRLGPGGALRTRGASLLEACAVFVVGFLMSHFFLFNFNPDDPSVRARRLPGNDSFYHLKMSKMMPEVGLLKTFPWLQFAYFRQQGDDFVSHHYGFQAAMIPFVKVSEWLGSDDLIGARVANCTFFALALLMFYLILRGEGVPFLWLWVLIFFLMPIQFYTRHSMCRAISPCLFLMLLLIWSMFRERWLLAGIVAALSNHMYLGAVLYSPIVVGAFVISSVLGRPEDRRFPWAMLIATAAGWCVGVVTYPYFGGMYEFLQLQIFGTGLTPPKDVGVGSEWYPYEGLWWFLVEFAGPVLALWTVSLLSRLRLGPRLSANELTLVILHFAFFLLTIKSKRFIEYWPLFCVASAAMLSKPGLQMLRDWIDRDVILRTEESADLFRALFASLAIGFLAWLTFTMVKDWDERLTSRMKEFAQTWECWVAIGIAFTVPFVAEWIRRRSDREARIARLGWLIPWSLAAAFGGIAFGSIMWTEVRESSRCSYTVVEIEKMMKALKADSQPGDVVFTSDWDDFPVYFYYNSHNYYVVGLDPVFTHKRRPDLWERYVKVTRGQVPTVVNKEMTDAKGNKFKERLEIKVQDIRDYFRSKYVISDRDHRALSNKVMGAKGFAELLYPSGGWEKNKNAQYVVFKILDEKATDTAPATSAPRP
ncbi:MAG TPA: hypothetical protein VNT79_05435 [Phycisphaerae bacterium]|nr:hypothetical protein [Phycisphaerae bacterium]